MTHVIGDLLGRKVDLDFAQVPTTVQSDLGPADVVASAYLQGGSGDLPAHLVVYYRGREIHHDVISGEVPPSEQGWAVAQLIHDDDEQKSYLANGDYDLTFAAAMAVFVRRVERQF